MTAMLVGSLTNIVLDYIFIYPMQLGMTGAALATATAPLVGMSILSMHFWKKKNQFHLVKTRIHLKTPSRQISIAVFRCILVFTR